MSDVINTELKLVKNCSADLFLINPIIISLFHIKIMANITKKLHQDCDPCYLHLPNYLLNIHSSLLKENKNLL